jgi:hypothetical protein
VDLWALRAPPTLPANGLILIILASDDLLGDVGNMAQVDF